MTQGITLLDPFGPNELTSKKMAELGIYLCFSCLTDGARGIVEDIGLCFG